MKPDNEIAPVPTEAFAPVPEELEVLHLKASNFVKVLGSLRAKKDKAMLDFAKVAEEKGTDFSEPVADFMLAVSSLVNAYQITINEFDIPGSNPGVVSQARSVEIETIESNIETMIQAAVFRGFEDGGKDKAACLQFPGIPQLLVFKVSPPYLR